MTTPHGTSNGSGKHSAVAGVQPLILVRYRPGITGHAARTVHFVPLPTSKGGEPIAATALCGLLLRAEQVETVPPGEGVPYSWCAVSHLATSPPTPETAPAMADMISTDATSAAAAATYRAWGWRATGYHRSGERRANRTLRGAYPCAVARADVGLAGAVVLALTIGLGLLLWPATGAENYRIALGTVLEPAQCGPPEARDSLRVELLDGREVPAWLDGCGNRPGEVLTVEVPDPLPAGDVVVRLAGTGVPAAAASAQRLAAIGVAVAGIAGAVLAWRLRLVHGGTGRRV
jgi:hypothetical protein